MCTLQDSEVNIEVDMMASFLIKLCILLVGVNVILFHTQLLGLATVAVRSYLSVHISFPVDCHS